MLPQFLLHDFVFVGGVCILVRFALLLSLFPVLLAFIVILVFILGIFLFRLLVCNLSYLRLDVIDSSTRLFVVFFVVEGGQFLPGSKKFILSVDHEQDFIYRSVADEMGSVRYQQNCGIFQQCIGSCNELFKYNLSRPRVQSRKWIVHNHTGRLPFRLVGSPCQRDTLALSPAQRDATFANLDQIRSPQLLNVLAQGTGVKNSIVSYCIKVRSEQDVFPQRLVQNEWILWSVRNSTTRLHHGCL
mmetsp:Transcript_12960/g.26846  ORF Transcript_12960/g.26846 Transcript_12960/m.26846 type:complete len:244 (+) Transcript_12960:1458-2189(+)